MRLRILCINTHTNSGTSIGLSVLKHIDPSLETDLYSDKPHAYSPLLATMTCLSIEKNATPSPDMLTRLHEQTEVLFNEQNVSTSSRRSYLSDVTHRKSKHIDEGMLIQGDFSNEFIDYNTLSVHLPVVNLSLGILQYWKGQSFR